MEALIKRRSVIKGLLTKQDKFASAISDLTSEEEVKERIKRTRELIESFTKIEDEMFEVDDKQQSDAEEFEDQYYRVIAKFNTWLRKQSMTSMQASESVTNATQGPYSSDVKLPRLNIPNFSGDYRDWQSFIDLFDSTVHKNTSLPPAQKLQYLKGLLKGDASNLLRHFSITEANYIEAYQKLCKRYDRKSVTANEFIKLFIDQPKIYQATATNVRKLLDTSDEVTRGLKALGAQAESKDVWLIYLLLNKIDDESKQLWKRLTTDDEFPTLQRFYEFLAQRSDELEGLKPSNKSHSNKSSALVKGFHAQSEFNCPVCQSSSHQLYECTIFKSMDVLARRDLIKREARCFNCLNSSHGVYDCRTKGRCHICRKKHHSLLHHQPTNEPSSSHAHCLESSEQGQSITKINPPTSTNCLSKDTSSTNLNVNVYQAPNSSYCTLLPTALIRIKDNNGDWQLCRALLDSGSQTSFASENLIKRLQLPRTNARITISGIGQTKTGTSKGKVNLLISSRLNKTILNVECLIVPKLTSLQPASFINDELWHHVTHLPLADPNFNQPDKIDLLIGSDHFFNLLTTGKITGENKALVAQNTVFGWIIAGPCTTDIRNTTNTNSLHCEVDIDNTLRRFWEIEEVPSNQAAKFTEEEISCEKHFTDHTIRSDQGKFIVQVPFKPNHQELRNTLNGAIQRLRSVEKKFKREPEFKTAYHSFMEEYLHLNHMEKIPPAEVHRTRGVYYLPHHGVVRESSSTTKLRVVFDASFKSQQGASLNEIMMVGPTIYEPLTAILIRFRIYKFVFTADIEKMFRQLILHPDDRDYHRIVWRSNPTDEPTHYRLRTVTYGTASAPYLETKSLQVIGNSVLKTNPLIAEKILHDFYVDDLMSGSHTLSAAQQTSYNISTLLKSYGFNLRKWASNHPDALADIPTESKEQIPINIENVDSNSSLKLLGVQWNPLLDLFQFKVASIKNSKGSKREVLSQSARIFDPLGWLAPSIVMIKILFQSLWLLQLDWDDDLREREADMWKTIKDELPELEKIRILRWHMTNESEFELHGFSDASEMAYAAVIYCRCIDENGEVRVSLVASKTKVAPIKQISIPRLELCAANLLTKLINTVKGSLNKPNIKITLWTDSQIVLGWLSSPPRRWSNFVANRTSNILSSYPRKHWNYVDSPTNPADCASRGLMPSKLVNFQLWWNGPTWLSQDAEWPEQSHIKPDDTIMEEKKLTVISAIATKIQEFCIIHELVNKISSFEKIVRVLAWVQKFVQQVKQRFKANPVKTKQLTVEELTRSRYTIIKWIQCDHFSVAINSLQSNLQVSRSSKISSLTPFLDDEGLLRVGGRIENSQAAFEVKHPLILPKCDVTTLLVRGLHNKHHHAGTSLLMSILRQTYFLINSRRIIRDVVKQCHRCRRFSPKLNYQIMGNLPLDRVQFQSPFIKTGVDFAGPIQIKQIHGRSTKLWKSYLAIFVCMSTKAVHIEVVSNLTTSNFIASLQRFVSRRGLCTDIYSDNGSNFVGANNVLLEINEFLKLNSNPIFSFLTTENIKWHFIPSAAPSFGGLWEAAVKSLKYHFRRVMGNCIFTYEELSTVVTQIEAILNSRPLCLLSDDQVDALTPGHFLIGRPIIQLPQPNLLDVKMSKLSKWQQLQSSIQHFSNRWKFEYLTSLHRRAKWQTRGQPIAVGDVVLIREDNLPPTRWLLGRVVQVHPGTDGVIRVCTLKTQSGHLKRPVYKLCLLPKSELNQQIHGGRDVVATI